MMNTYGFDGVDIDWEYPVDPDRGGKAADFKNFSSWMKDLKSTLQGKGLSVTLPSSYWYLQHFDITGLESSVDWFNVMLYDLHGTWDLNSKWTGPYLNAHTNLTEIQDSLDLLWRNNIDPDKVVFGMGFYGRSFTVQNPGCTTPGCLFASGGTAGKCSKTIGVLLNSEIQDLIKEKNLTPKLYDKEAVKVLTWDTTQWVSYDDEETFKMKADLAKSQCIKNVMVWAVSHDDRDGTSAKALTTALGREVMSAPKIEAKPAENSLKRIQTCRWSNCGESCPAGFKNVMRNGTSETMVDGTGCPGQSPHQWCCPSDYELPVCTWRGFRNSGACRPGCLDGEAEVGSLSTGCSSKHQSACCTVNPTTQAYSKCQWFGESPTCSGSGGYKACEGDWPNRIVSASSGAGGEQTCSRGAKSYCCKEIPDDFTDCAWYKNATQTVTNKLYCETSCPTGMIRLSMQQGSGCGYGGLQAYCCKGKPASTIAPRDPSWGNNQYSEFQSLLLAWSKNPGCPVSIGIEGNDYFYDTPVGLERRDDAQCTVSDFTRLQTWIVTILKNPASTPDTIKYGWDNIIAAFDSTGGTLGYDNLQDLINNNDWDSYGLISDVLLDPYMAQRNIYNFQEVQKLCGLGVGASKRDILEERRIFISGAGDGPNRNRTMPQTWRFQPDSATILDGIAIGDLEMRYGRWQREQGGTRMFLELGYQ